MIDLYTASTPNGQKIHIMLEEAELEYTAHFVALREGGQFDPAFLKINPNNKIPAIVDQDGPDGQPVSVFESGCILLYLAEKSGRFLPTEARARIETLEWLFWQMGGFGPMLGQAHHFRAYAPERVQYAYDRYTNEAGRLYQVLDNRLDGDAVILEDDGAFFEGEEGVVPAAAYVATRFERRAALADDDRSGLGSLATVELDPAILRVAVTTVPCGTLSLFMGHRITFRSGA